MDKYPKETKEYYIGFCVECAEDFLEDTVEDFNSKQPLKKKGKK